MQNGNVPMLLFKYEVIARTLSRVDVDRRDMRKGNASLYAGDIWSVIVPTDIGPKVNAEAANDAADQARVP